MKQNLLFNQASALGKRLAMVLTMLLTVGIGQTWGAEDSYSCTNTSGSTSPITGTSTSGCFTVKFEQNTASSWRSSNEQHWRLYSGSKVTITPESGITISQLVITTTSNDYATAGQNATWTNATATASSSTITVTPTDGNQSVTCVPSAQTRWTKITITYESATPKQEYTLSYQAGESSGILQVEEGANLLDVLGELETPTSCDATSTTFVGWTATKITEKTNTAPTFITSTDVMPSADFAVFAVFAENSGGTSFDGTTGGNFKIYAIVKGTKYYANGTGSKISSTTEESDATEYTFAKTSTGFTIKTGTLYITYSSSTDLGTSTTAYNWDISEGTNGSWRITSTANTSRGIIFRASTFNQFGGYSVGNASAGSTEYFDVEIGSSPSFSNYITSCTTQTLVTLNPNGGTISDTNWKLENGVYKLTTEDESITLPTITRDGYTFSHWDTQADDKGTDYNPDDIINLNGTPITLYAQWECTMASISISGAYALTQGQEFLLTAIAKDSEGNEIECPDDAIYTWQYWDGSNWQDVNDNESSDKTKLQYASCNVVDHCGKFRCIISYGDCIAYSNTNTQDDGYKVHVYHIKGFGEWSTPYPFIYDANTGEAVLTMELEAYTPYEFSIFGSSTQFFNGGTITANATDWVYGLTNYGNTKITTTIAGVYIFTLDYSEGESNNLKLDVTYPSKRIIYLEPNIWGTDPKFAVHAWGGNSTEDILMTKIDDCASRNIYYAEIDASQTNVTFIRGNTDNYDISNPWENVWNQTVDLTLGNDNLFYVDNWHDANDYNKSNGYWTTFTPNYLVTFDVQGHGTAPEDQCITDGGKVTNPGSLSATGYTFGGWYKEAGCTNAWDFENDVVTENITLYAKWTINTHTVTWKPAGGNWSGDTNDIVQTYEYDELIEAPEEPVRTGYEFVEWKPTYTADMTMPDKDLEFTAQWQINQYTVTLHPNYPDGKTGTFKDKDGNTISGDLVLTYDYGTASQTITELYQTIKLDGYRFDGWYNAKGASEGTVSGSKWSVTGNITSDLNFYAKWTEVDCRWIETDIANILPEDEVLITMKRADDGDTYTLDHSKGTSELPPAPTITIHGNEAIFTTFYHSNSIWNISGNATDGYILYPNGSKTTWLYCTKSNYNVKVGTITNNVFTIDQGYLKHTNTDWVAYLGVYINNGNPIWRHHDSQTAPSIAGQTLKFYKRVCVDASNPWYTVTFDAGSGSCNTESLTGTKNEGITLPTATPSDACAIDGWIFAGWWTDEVGETTTSPGELLTAESNYKPEGNITLHAVYSKEETDEGGDTTPTEATLSFASTAQRTSFSTTQQIWEQNGITLTNNQAASTSPVADYASPARFYANSEIIIEAPGNITQIVFDCNSDGYATAMKNSIGAETSVSDDKVTLELGGTSNTYTVSSISAQVRIDALTVTYLAESGPTITTTYNSNPSCEACENILTISKGEETNENTFTLSQIDDIETCDGDVEVLVNPTSAEHYSVSEVTATTPTTGGTPTITDNGDGTWTVTYAQDSKGESTISVTFVEDAKASITLSELGVTSTIDTYYVGEQYTLPTTSSQSCEGKELVGWSTVEVAETDTKPTENYYELGAEVTLEAEQTFYAVFATAGEGGGGNGIVFKETFDTNDGTGGNDSQWGGTIASSDISSDHTWVFFNAKGAFKCAKFASNSSGGSATTPAIDCSGSANATLTFKAGSWKGDETTLNIESTNCTVDLTSVDLPDQTWGEYIVNITSITGEITITFSSDLKNRFFLDEVEITTSGGVSYTGYTTSCVPTYSITYDFAGGTGSHCSNTSVPQGESYTICEDEPTKTGYTFLHWSDSTTTYAAGATITPTSNITLTAVWQINTYTVIWSNNGATTEESYEHGQTLNVPAPEDIPSCDGVKEFVGWTEDNTFTYHATTPPSDLFTEKTATVTADATYYAVFATPPGTGGGGGGSETITLDFTAQGYADATAINKLTVDGVTATFDKGSNSNAPKYYTNGTAIRAYGGNTITLSANQITAATFTFGGSDGSNDITADCGSWESPTWTGDATDEVVFTIDGTSGNRRIQSIAVTCTSGGGSGSYSDYTTICQQIESIEVQNPQTEFYLTDNFTIGEGKVIATLSGGGTADVTALATFSGYDMEKVGTYTVTVTYMGATATYNINVKPLDNAWVLTWNVSGKTNTGLGPRTVNKGSAIGTLPVPEVPAACEGKTFMGWTESNTVPSDGIGIVYITPETVPTDNTTYYAVFATVNNFCTQKPIDQISSGSKVVIVAVASLTADGGSGKAISSRATDDTYNLQGDDVAIYDQTINTPHSTCIWTISKSGEKYIFIQDGKYLNGVLDGMYSNLKYLNTEDSWTLHPAKSGMTMTYNMESTNASGEYIEWFRGKFAIHNEVNDNGDFDMQFYVTLGDGADITDYTTGCEEYTITYYGFRGGYSTSSSSDGIIVLPVNSKHTVPDCGDVVKDHTDLGREFLNLWMTEPHGGQTFKPGDTFILTQDTTLYAQWELNTTTDVTLPTGVEDLAGTDVYVYGGNTLTMVPDIVTINSLTLKGGLQPDGSYQMPNVWIPDGATLVRNTNKIYLDLAINAKNWYPFAVPFATKNDQYLDYLDPVLRDASTYGTHFAIKTYDGARRAEVGEDKANNWKQLKRHTGGTTSYLEPGVGYIISAMTKSDKDTATIRIPMTVPNTWFENGEQTVVGSTSRNTIAVTAYTGAAATEHRRHAGWNFIASPYLSEFAGNKVDNNGGKYINGWINIANQYNYEDTEIPYVTIPVYNFAYYEQKKVSEATLSPEWSFFVQIAVDGTIDFVEEGRQTVPAGIAARTQEERSVKMDIDINLTDGRNTDQMGIIVCEKYSDAYEIGRDLEKMFGSAYNLVVYSLMSDNTPLAYQAVPLLNETHAIPIGYRAPEQGEYTFSLKQNTSSIDLLNEQYEQLVLVDYEKGALTNLLNSDYTFSSERTQSNSRFALYAVPRQDSSTELPNISDEEDAIRKIFYNGHLFIIRNGNVYNGNGQIVK